MTVWKGRFKARLHSEALEFSSSLPVDKRLYEEDITGSIAHVKMLSKQSVITASDAARIIRGLQQVRRELRSGTFFRNTLHAGRFSSEDIHMAIEHRLMQKIGTSGGKLHTARSRNDQIALDERLFLRKHIKTILGLMVRLQGAFLDAAERNREVIMPGYTHLQQAQPIFLSHHLLAYVSMLARDYERFDDCLRRVVRSPLGAGALAGTSFPIDRHAVARSLGFTGIIENSIDAVSDRDVLIEFTSACAIAMMHLSRFAEELVLWSSQEWQFVEMADAFTTGSSIMPQKKNPDMAELIRGKTGRVYGDLVALLTIMKGLPLAYNRDMQEDKEPLFDAVDTVTACVRIMTLVIKTSRFKSTRFSSESTGDLFLATEIADYLVRKGLPFRKAHAVTGAIVAECTTKQISLHELPLRAYRRHSPKFESDIFPLLHTRPSLNNKKSAGSSSPKEVLKQINFWKRKLKMQSRS